MSQNFTVPFVFSPSTATSPSYVKSSEINTNFNCITLVLSNTESGHKHDGYDSALIDFKCGITYTNQSNGVGEVTFDRPFTTGLSFCVLASCLSNTTLPLTDLHLTVLTTPWFWNNAGFSFTVVSGANSTYNASTYPAYIQWHSYAFKP